MAGGTGGRNNGSSSDNANADDFTFGSLLICGISTSCILFATGLACIILFILQKLKMGLDDDNDIKCGQDGNPPLLQWVLGAGISFLIITCAFCRVSKGEAGTIAKLIMAVANLFIFVWAIVGAFSLWKQGKDCKLVNKNLWRMGYAAVLISFIVCCCGGFVGYKQQTIPTAEAVIVSDEEQQEQSSSIPMASIPVAVASENDC